MAEVEGENASKNILPWANFKQFFSLEEKNVKGNNFMAKCLLCVPAKKMISASKSSASNLRAHIKSIHPSQLSKVFFLGSGRKRVVQAVIAEEDADDAGQPTPKKEKQTTLQDFEEGRVCSQAEFNKLLENFIVKGLHPFSIVESNEFLAMIKGIAPGKTVVSPKMLMKQIEATVIQQKTDLQEIISGLDFVSTTADSWKTFNRSYIGVTLHYINPQSLERKTTVLACRRVIGSQIFDVIGKLLAEINQEFAIQNKVVSTTTDNGSNFVKAFRIFGKPEEEANSEEEDEFFELGPILEKPTDSYSLPPHQRCVAHTMNLVATKDTESACENAQFKRRFRSTMGLCQGLWNKQSSSSLHADVIKEKLGIYLTTPNATRWNALFESVNCLNRIAKEKLQELHQVCDKLGLQRFRKPDELFMSEYCKTMKPVATALNQLQSEKFAYMAVLLPTLYCLRRRLVTLKESGELEICEPLVTALINGIDTRFNASWFQRDLVLAAALHPQFQFSWIKDGIKETQARSWLQEEIQKAVPAVMEEVEVEANDEDASFDFQPPTSSSTTSGIDEMNKFISFTPPNLQVLQTLPIIKKLFLKYNTPIPSSAGVERIFSAGGLIHSERRGKMSDKNFENSLFLKVGL